jgi:hypothetical protein
MPEVTCEYVPDALFTWFPALQRAGRYLPTNGDFIIAPPERAELFGKLDFDGPYVCIGGSSWAANHQRDAVDHYRRLLEAVQSLGLPVYLTENCGGDRFLQDVARATGCGIVPASTPIYMAGAVLANAALSVSGRFHPTILASLGGTPTVFLGAHSHKMSSLQRTLEYEVQTRFAGMPTADDIAGVVALGRRYLEEGPRLRERIRATAARRCVEASRLPERILAHLERSPMRDGTWPSGDSRPIPVAGWRREPADTSAGPV